MLTSVLEHGRQSFFYKLYGLAHSEIQQADIQLTENNQKIDRKFW